MSNNTRSDTSGTQSQSNGTSHTTFGQSVESQAQIEDAANIANGTSGETLNVYRLVPVAKVDDPRWDNAPGFGEVVVAARTSGDARIVAAARELDYMDIDAAPAEGSTTSHASSFRNELLYTVIEIESHRSDLKRGILEGDIGIDSIRPTQV
ncbi:hypothetical protein [Rhizobium sp. Leaf262]|uniref:hypothetical protein n=1 Tax=Rhizobium sp. Leaf262 TaxID=1736312 RepID=UPI0007137ED1|nr:hypothetical protein [Rhizobium sp. Leaf262]KQO83403.1 hypothetical protein ASF29_00740 [Rhizobium sp. Leaf262]